MLVAVITGAGALLLSEVRGGSEKNRHVTHRGVVTFHAACLMIDGEERSVLGKEVEVKMYEPKKKEKKRMHTPVTLSHQHA